MSPTDSGAQQPRLHPGSGRRQAIPHPKGRIVGDADLAEVRSLLGEKPRRRDLLIEHLHLLQDHFGCLHSGHLAALAEEMKLSQVEVYEVATFYAHFDVVLEGESPPAPLTVRVCDSISCSLAGSRDILMRVQESLGAEVRVINAPCIGRCDWAPAAFVGQRVVESLTVETLLDAINSGHTQPEIPDYANYEAYRQAGGYQIFAHCQAGTLTLADVISQIEAAGLRGLGGAGFPSAQKWKLVGQQPKPRLFAVNGDEGEPGTFKDRHYLETQPHQFLEGMLIAAWAIEADHVYVYLRDEYPHIRKILLVEIAKLEEEGLIEPGYVELRRGAGAYICGEETAMLESIEGKRGYPRQKPPFPTQVGLFGRPTLIHNVETLYWVPTLLKMGPEWFAGQGRNGRKGLRSFSVSGRVKNHGVKLAPAGITIKELIHEFCGGMLEGHKLKGYLPGGASGGILPARMADIPLDFGTLETHGCFIGSAAVVVLSDQDNIRELASQLMEFFEDESCGQCTPCRVGTEKAVQLMSNPPWNQALLSELSTVMRDASICGLGQAAANPLLCAMRYFPEDLK